MSSISHKRCSGDMDEFEDAQIGENPGTGQPIMLSLGGVASVVAVQSAMTTLGAVLKNGHEKDFLEKITLALYSKLKVDPHTLCPLLTVCVRCLLLLTQKTEVTFDKENHLIICAPDVLDTDDAWYDQTCIFDADEEEDEDYGTDEGTVGEPGPGPVGCDSGEGDDGINP